MTIVGTYYQSKEPHPILRHPRIHVQFTLRRCPHARLEKEPLEFLCKQLGNIIDSFGHGLADRHLCRLRSRKEGDDECRGESDENEETDEARC